MNADHRDYWQVQLPNKPLYEDLLWSQPQTKTLGGKVLIIGGNVHSLSAPAKAYNFVNQAGIGSLRLVLPDSLRTTIKTTAIEAFYCPSTPSGSFAKSALAEILEHAAWADLSLVIGDLGRNSETAILLESFCTKYSGPLAIIKDGLDYFVKNPEPLLSRQKTLIVADIARLQKILLKIKPDKPITFAMSLLNLVEVLHQITKELPASFITKHGDSIVVASDGQVSTTKLEQELKLWQVMSASYASVWWLQNLSQPFQALTTSVYRMLE